jgi:tetratricopeptide (TPR) repeat protein
MSRAFGHSDVPGYVIHVHEAARLAERAEDPALSLAVTAGLVLGGFLDAKVGEAIEIGRRGLEAEPDEVSLGSEHWVYPPYAMLLGFTRLLEAFAGRPSGAIEELQRPLRIAREHGSAELQSYLHLWMVNAAELLGRPDIALAHGRQGVENAEKSGVPTAVVYANYSLGTSYCMAASWEEAAQCLERAIAVAKDEGAALLEEPIFLARLAEAYAGLGDFTRARETVERGLALARERRLPVNEVVAQIIRVRVLLRSQGTKEREAIQTALAEAEALVKRTGMRSWQPFLHLESAQLAGLTGDDAGRRRELREAQRLFAEMGATAQVERLSRELAS